CSICIEGRPIIRRTKRSLDCVRCTYLQPSERIKNPFVVQPLPTSPYGIPPAHIRKKRSGKCLRRDKYSSNSNCEVDEFLVTRMKRQAYNPSGILDIVKMMSKTMASASSHGCIKFPACVLAKRKRRKRHAARLERYHMAKIAYERVIKDHHEYHTRQKRQFFAPDANAACVPCPAWVTLALASRKKRSTTSSEEHDNDIPRMSISEAIADIRKKAGYKLGFDGLVFRLVEENVYDAATDLMVNELKEIFSHPLSMRQSRIALPSPNVGIESNEAYSDVILVKDRGLNNPDVQNLMLKFNYFYLICSFSIKNYLLLLVDSC
ncbi:hypothetical protein DICVIV_02245, partial [Dictyocaulus viviparus]